MIARTSVVAVLAALVGVGVAYGGSSSAEPTVYQFLLDWQSKQYLQAARLTTGQPQLVAGELAEAYSELDASDLSLTMRSVVQHGSTADAQFGATIDLGSSSDVWSYNGGFGLRADGSGWQVVWHPSVIMPKLGTDERLAVVSTEQQRADILDASGNPLTVLSPVYEIGVVPGKLRRPSFTADEIAKIAGLPANQVKGQIEAAPSRQFLELLTLAPTSRLRDKLAAVQGVVVKVVDKRLFDSIAPDVVGTVCTENCSVLRKNGLPYQPGTTVGLSGLQQAYQTRLTGTAQTEVVIQRAGVPVDVLKRFRGVRAKPVRTTLQSSVQVAADRALAQAPASAAIVAVQPDTGQILAVASDQAGGLPELNPLAGEYQPGQAFTIVSSAAMLAASSVTPASTVFCFQTNTVDGRRFVNDPPEPGPGGSATFQEAFADACSTAFAGASLDLNSTYLSKIAASFGVGDWQLPPLSSHYYYAGTIGQPSGAPELAADTIGDGSVKMSPLGMALAAAVVDSGRWHPPSLIRDVADPTNASQGTMSSQVVDDLRDLMHNAVTSGAGRAANVGGDVFGQVGNAPFGLHNLRISWFVGYQGSGIAFAVVELGRSATDSAASLAGSFLRDIRTGS